MSAGGGSDFFRPLWLRATIVAACAGWAVLEYASGQSGWAMIAAAVTAYGVWSFLIAWKPDGPGGGKPGGEGRE